MVKDILQLPFTQVALPVMATLVASMFFYNKRLDDLRLDFVGLKADFNRRIDDVIKRLDRIEAKLDNHEQRITRLEERTSLFR